VFGYGHEPEPDRRGPGGRSRPGRAPAGAVPAPRTDLDYLAVFAAELAERIALLATLPAEPGDTAATYLEHRAEALELVESIAAGLQRMERARMNVIVQSGQGRLHAALEQPGVFLGHCGSRITRPQAVLPMDWDLLSLGRSLSAATAWRSRTPSISSSCWPPKRSADALQDGLLRRRRGVILPAAPGRSGGRHSGRPGGLRGPCGGGPGDPDAGPHGARSAAPVEADTAAATGPPAAGPWPVRPWSSRSSRPDPAGPPDRRLGARLAAGAGLPALRGDRGSVRHRRGPGPPRRMVERLPRL
jgi:hypothetical protein